MARPTPGPVFRDVLLGALALALSLSVASLRDRDLRMIAWRTERSGVPVLEVRRAGGPPASAAAILVHGLQCNRGMMAPLAKTLARAGVDAYAIDLPGHGSSPEAFSPARAREAAREAIAAVRARRGDPREPYVLVAHSYGAQVVGPIASGAPLPRAIVLVAPTWAKGVGSGAIRNLLVLTATRDYDFVTEDAGRLLGAAAPGPGLRAGEEIGDAARGTARAWRVVEGAHVSLLYGGAAPAEARAWILRALGVAPEPAAPAADAGLFAGLLSAALALAAAVLLVRAWAAALPVPERPRARCDRGTVLIAAVALAAGVGALRIGVPLAFLRLHEGARLASLLLVVGLVAAGLTRLRRSDALPTVAELARGLPPGLLGAAAVLAAAAALSSASWYELPFPGAPAERWSAALVLAAALLPLFAFVQGHLSFASRAPRVPGLALALAVHAGLAAAVVLLGARLGRFAGALLVVGLALAAFGAVLGRAARNRAVGAVFSSAVAGWVAAAGFLRY